MLHVVSVRDFSSDEIRHLMRSAAAHKAKFHMERQPLKHRRLVTLFYEPSTGTRISLEAAMQDLGGRVISVADAKTTSLAKGEAFEDAIRRIACDCDVIALRHPDAGAAERAAKLGVVPIINAGDGANEHPLQGLTDLFTIWEACETRKISERHLLRVHFYGDNLKARTVRSLAYLLAKHARILDMRIEALYFGGPYRECALPDIGFHTELIDLVGKGFLSNQGLSTPSNVVYITRVQKERYAKTETFTLEEATGREAVHWLPTFSKQHAVVMDRSSIIMHPLPRLDELSTDVDSDPRAWYFSHQAPNKRFVEMALLEMVLGE